MNLEKLDRLSLAAFRNAVRLHLDAISLYRDKRYPSAFLLSVLSQEEIGKAHMISNFVASSKDSNGYPEKMEKEFLELLYKHPLKQGAFLRYSSTGVSMLSTKKGRQLYEGVFNGSLEGEKQKATYASLKKKGKVVDIKGSIISPNKITREKSEKQISRIHDSLVDSCAGIIADSYDFEIPGIKKVLNRRTYKRLRNLWPIHSEETRQWVKKIKRFLKEEGRPL